MIYKNTELLFCMPETNIILCQLYFNFQKFYLIKIFISLNAKENKHFS